MNGIFSGNFYKSVVGNLLVGIFGMTLSVVLWTLMKRKLLSKNFSKRIPSLSWLNPEHSNVCSRKDALLLMPMVVLLLPVFK